MPVKCVVCGEVRNNKSIVSFHRFPKEQLLRQKWLTACKLENYAITTNSVVCSKHFRIYDFDETYWPQRRLLLSAVPAPSFNSCDTKTEESTTSLVLSCNLLSNVNECTTFSVSGSDKTVPADLVVEPKITPWLDKNTSSLPSCSIVLNDNNGCTASVTVSTSAKPISFNDEPPSPRYVGDLKVEHFATPRKAKRRLVMLTNVIESQRKKIRALQNQNQRIQKQIKKFKGFINYLHEKEMLNENTYKILISYHH
ncbi:hypothetical protein ABEB36_013319 [Hypothenemus hampei]|uniref:THAP-type domain-containing protein n=1 Tax=Hypothenemus hampei TaxID=57062 RepID=A0ABD1E8D2_HYPHA